MTELDDAKEALLSLGWSEYESKTYSALVKNGQTTASKIAKDSNVPPNRVYQILGKLSEDGIVKKITTVNATTEYSAEPPNEVLDRLLNEYQVKIQRAKDTLEELTERSDDENLPITYTIYGRREMNSYLQKMLKTAEDSILFAVDTMLEIKYAEIMEALNERKDDIEIKIMTLPRGLNNEYEKEVEANLEEGIEVAVSDQEFSNVIMIKDGKELLHTVYGYNDEDKSEKDFYGIFTKDRRNASMFSRTFLMAWEKADKIREEEKEEKDGKPEEDENKASEEMNEEKSEENNLNDEMKDDNQDKAQQDPVLN